MKELARDIRAAREALGLSQSSLAAAAGVSLATVQNVEAGRANPALGTVRSLLAELGLRLDLRPEPADWEALAALGLPLAAERRSEVVRDGPSLAGHLRRAVREVADNPAGPERERQRDALQALLFALHAHFASFYRRSFGRSPVARSLMPQEPSGRVIKLARMARATLAEYL